MEMLITMAVITIFFIISLPLITQFSMIKIGMNKNVMKCIDENSSAGWYDTDGAGATILPTTDPCRTAVIDVQYDKNRALSSVIKTAERGTSAQTVMAKRLLRTACDLGGTGACDFFINTCRKNGLVSSPYCDDLTDYTDISYYLHLNKNTYSNFGGTYIANQLKTILSKTLHPLLAETINASSTAPNANNNLATDIAEPFVYIQACNTGISSACTIAYNNNYNKSCSQILGKWTLAPTKTYNLTYDASGTIQTVSVNCDMTNPARAAITGCNSINSNLLTNAPDDDCTVAYNHSYNRSCSELNINWDGNVPSNTYNLTKNGAPPAALVPTLCPPSCVTAGPGTVCADGTVFAGTSTVNKRYYFTTSADQGLFTWETNNNTTLTNANDLNDGSSNTSILQGRTNPPDVFAPYRAAQACYSATDSGYTDWYLPARNELSVLYANRIAIGNFSLINYYWSSTENNSIGSTIVNFSNGNIGNNYNKWNNYNVRCVRKQLAVDTTCPSAGDTCADGTKYAGPFSTYYLYTTTLDKGQFPWNYGYALGSNTMATDPNYGMSNYIKLINLIDDYSPYNAALACKALNDASTFGYTDWYLPARNEISILFNNRTLIGGFASAMYWTSTETGYYQANCLNFGGTGGFSNYEKWNNYRVRCVRRD